MLHEVRASIDAVERLGVAVGLETRGQLPALPLALRLALLESPMSTLASAVTKARVVIVSGPQSVSVSTDGPPGPQQQSDVTEGTRTATMMMATQIVVRQVAASGHPVVVYTMTTDTVTVLTCLDLGAACFLTKAEGRVHLVAAIQAQRSTSLRRR